jgi:putative nucleotidyltransferase with HDIG domain
MIVLPAIAGGVVITMARVPLAGISGGPLEDLLGAALGATVFFSLNLLLAGFAVALRTGTRLGAILRIDAELYANLFMLAPLAWLMAQMYLIAWWASLLFALPLYTTRVAYHRFVEMREMFTQTIGALAEAVDKRDPFTSRHSRNVKEIAVAIGRIRKVSSADLDALEWGGLLHDIGKIGVPDSILLKPDRLTKEERAQMNAHPEKGAEIIEQVKRLAPVVPLIRHHHEWFNGSGYPQRLVGMEIPELARIVGVADAFEAMTSARPYRMTPLTHAEALAELRRFAGIQFDPQMVEAFARTEFARDVPDPARPNEPRQIPSIQEVAERLATASAAEPGAAAVENG